MFTVLQGVQYLYYEPSMCTVYNQLFFLHSTYSFRVFVYTGYDDTAFIRCTVYIFNCLL